MGKRKAIQLVWCLSIGYLALSWLWGTKVLLFPMEVAAYQMLTIITGEVANGITLYLRLHKMGSPLTSDVFMMRSVYPTLVEDLPCLFWQRLKTKDVITGRRRRRRSGGEGEGGGGGGREKGGGGGLTLVSVRLVSTIFKRYKERGLCTQGQSAQTMLTLCVIGWKLVRDTKWPESLDKSSTGFAAF